MTALWQGILLGLSLSVLLGPMVFIYLDATLREGTKAGILIGFGVWTSDIIYILLSVFGFAFFKKAFEIEGIELGLGIVGGLILIAMGINTLWQAKKKVIILPTDQNESANLISPSKLWLKGFLVNTLNPFSALIWMGAVSSLMINADIKNTHLLIFISGVLGTIILTDILKIYLAERLINLLSETNQIKIRKFAGASIFLLGLALIVKVVL